MMRKFLLVLLLFSYVVAFGQSKTGTNNSKTISYTQFLNEIYLSKDSIFSLENVVISNKKRDNEKLVFSNSEPPIVIKPKIILRNVKFENGKNQGLPIFLSNFIFENEVSLNITGVSSIISNNCIFKGGLNIVTDDFLMAISMDEVTINHFFLFDISQTKHAKVILKNSNFSFDKNDFNSFWRWRVAEDCYFTLDKCKITTPYKSKVLEINSPYSNNVKLISIDSSIIDPILRISKTSIDNLFLKETKLNGISLYRTTLPNETNFNCKWKFLHNKLGIINQKETINDGTYHSNLEFYQAKNDEEISNEYTYDDLMSIYLRFFRIYKERGDIESANKCYVDLKNIETRRLKYLYKTEGGIKNLLNYNLNRFLKYFAEYGTSPVRSVQISGWVIMIFAFFYFFFYSDWDRINRKFLINRGEKLISYFRSEQKLEELYSDKHKEDISTFSQFKQNLKDSKTEVPFFFMLFLKPLYWISVVKHHFNSFLYKRVEFLQGRWSDLSGGKKWIIGTLTFFTILTYGLYLIMVRSLNSLILSINTFTTLGFGDIPVVGISRYVAILEGFLGWFLLSIFSVSLISQILQN